MQTKARTLGNHVFFYPESAGVSDSTHKPAADAVGWVDLGQIENLKVTPKTKVLESYGHFPGKRMIKDRIYVQADQTISFKVAELSNLVIQLQERCGTLSGNTPQWNPLEGDEVRGWLKIQQYDHKNNLVATKDVWADLEIDSVEYGDELVTPEVTATVLYSSLNTANLENV